MSKVTSIKFRMYNTGSVGDCLLLLFMKGNAISFKMLIDCGGWTTNTKLISPCVTDIKNICNGQLDLLVMTHQHKDHVSGFNQARPVFDQISVKQVWMSWMENPKDSIAKIVQADYGKKIKAAIKQVKAVRGKLNQFSKSKSGYLSMGTRFDAKTNRADLALDLLELEVGTPLRGAKKVIGTATNQQAVDYIKSKTKNIAYWKPGEVALDVPGAEGMKFFMLGPPRDKDLKLFFTKTEVKSEIFELANKAAFKDDENETTADTLFFSSGTVLKDGESPFSSRYKIKGGALTDWNKDYNGSEMKWRQIETDSEETALSIALRANTYTNNTSFAMAIEFEESGRVVLLPGDAQSGNWMGWHKPDVKKALIKNGRRDTVDLLANTVFYKIGHHCSENGTASVSGLNHMTSPELVGFIPLIKSQIPEAWHPEGFPARPLYRELIKKTNGRLVRIDQGVITDARAKKLRDALTKKERDAFSNAYTKGTLFHEFVINGKK